MSWYVYISFPTYNCFIGPNSPTLSPPLSSLNNHSSHLTSILVNFQQLGHGPAAQQQQHGHSHGAQPQQHGHSHGGKPCHGMFCFVFSPSLILLNTFKLPTLH
jgi:hypothetical protein